MNSGHSRSHSELPCRHIRSDLETIDLLERLDVCYTIPANFQVAYYIPWHIMYVSSTHPCVSLTDCALVLLYHGELISAFGSGQFLSHVDYVRFASVAGFVLCLGGGSGLAGRSSMAGVQRLKADMMFMGFCFLQIPNFQRSHCCHSPIISIDKIYG